VNLALRASDGDRDQVTELLHAAYADGRLTQDEHTDRVAAAIRATTFGDLTALTADLVPAPVARIAPLPDNAQPERLTAVLSESKRRGVWVVQPVTHATAVLGEVVVDLTEATFAVPTVVIDCSVFAGQVTIRVPLGTNVSMLATAILAENSVKGIGTPDPSMPTVVVKGTAIVGEICVRGPRRPPFWKRRVA